jgi:hypothetical protein
MTALMRPYLMLIMRKVRAAMPEIRALMPGAMAGDKKSIDDLTELTQGLMQDMAFITSKMNEVTMPIAGALDGFKRGIDIMFNNFLTGANASFEATITSISSNFRPMPKTLVDWIHAETNKNPQFFNDLPKNISDAYLADVKAGLSGNVVTDLVNGIAGPVYSIGAGLQTTADWFTNMVNKITGNALAPYSNKASTQQLIDAGIIKGLPSGTTYGDVFRNVKAGGH